MAIRGIGVQTKEAIDDACPEDGFRILKEAGFMDLHQIPFTFAKTRENRTSTDWNGFIRGLKGIGFDKVLSFETAPVLTAFPEEMKEETLRFINRIGVCFLNELQ